MATILVHILAWFVTIPAVTEWLIRRAKKTPYSHIRSADKTEIYMERYWLFNPYPTPRAGERKVKPAPTEGNVPREEVQQAVEAVMKERKRPWRFPISIRLHYIRREDLDRHHHDHPWNCHSIILKGWYTELREQVFPSDKGTHSLVMRHLRLPGEVVRIDHNQFHKISYVPEEGVWTMFITGKKRHTWGFNVDGQKVPFRDYKGL